ncbi:hypothetical protein ACS0TY_022537 [Phlomoides rotata]
MASISTLSINTAVFHSTTQLPAAQIRLPKCFIGNDRSKHMSLNYQIRRQKQKQKSRVAECRASLDVPQVRDKVGSTSLNLELVDKKIEENIEYVKALLSSIDDGRINISPYDTAWIGLIKDLEGYNRPQFPTSLVWIAEHQLIDGSWGDEKYFLAYDRIINTLACVVVLRTWDVHQAKIEKGISYLKENINKLEDAHADHMTQGFEIVFPALLQRAQNLGIHDIPYDAPIVKHIYNLRDLKLKRITKEKMHKGATTLLYSMEGLDDQDLEWEELLKLQSPADGSFLTSPASTAFAFMHTKDLNCLKYINYILQKFSGAAPSQYPVDLFARLWAVDRLNRLGISRFFEPQIKDCLSYVYRFWTETGIFGTRDTEPHDIDDTSMGFRLLRLHGYDMDPNVLKNFKKEGKFYCLGGEMTSSATATYNLYRATQIQFPGEEILEEARNFSYKVLQDKLANNQLADKWVISKHLPDEIKIGLELSWYTCLPRVEAAYYLQHYGASNDVWIGKSLYRMEDVSNDTYLELARLDFSRCQAQHHTDWNYLQEWYESSNVEEFGISKKEVLLAFFLAAATVFEPERTRERIVWVKTQIISTIIKSFFNNETTSLEQRNNILTRFEDHNDGLHQINSVKREHEVANILLATLHRLLDEFDEYITSHQLKNAWRAWLMKLQQGEEENGGSEAELIITTLNICAGYDISFKEDILSQNEYEMLSELTNKICHRLAQIQIKKVLESNDSNTSVKDEETEHDMRLLAKLVLEESAIRKNVKQTFLSVAKTYYYGTYIPTETIDVHIFKVVFEPVV